MKTTIMHLMSLFLVLAFTASCGKSEKGGSGSTYTAENFTSGNTTGDAALNAVKAWVAAADDTQLGRRGHYLRSTATIAFMCGSDIGIPQCSAPTGCFERTSLGVQIGQVVMKGSSDLRFDKCVITGGYVPYNKSADQNLKDAVNGKAGQYVIPSLTTQTGSIFRIYYSSVEGSINWNTYSEINTSLPAILNPTIYPEGTKANRLVDFKLY